MNTTDISLSKRILNDPFCEAEMWERAGLHNGVVQQPFSTVTGLLMMVMACLPLYERCEQQQHMSKLLLLCKASLFLVGIGTIIYHAVGVEEMANAHLNHGMCDWLPIVLMLSNICVLYATRLWHSDNSSGPPERTWLVVFVLLLMWMFVLVVGMDSDTDGYWSKEMGASGSQGQYGTILNLVLLLPVALLLAYCCWYHFEWRYSRFLLASLGVSVGMWLLNGYLCRDHLWLSVLHALYHLTAAYGFLYGACLGASLHNSTHEFGLSRWGWPMLCRIPRYSQCDVVLVYQQQADYYYYYDN